jgi:putative membrane protein
MFWWYMGWAWWGWLGMLVLTLVFLGFALLGVMALLEIPGSSERRYEAAEGSPGEILAKRLARGEIDTEEYVRRLEVLGLRSPPQDTELGSKRESGGIKSAPGG